MKGWKTLGFALFVALGGVLQAFDWMTVVPQDKKWSGILMLAIGAVVAALRTVTSTPIGKAVIAFLALSMASLVVAGSPVSAADMPAKAPTPFVLGYSGSGWYKGIGTFAEMNDSQTALGNVNTFGGALNVVGGYQWANRGGGSFTAIEFSCAYHNVGGSNLVGAISSKWSCDQGLKLGGPITNVLQWLPAGASMPTFPALGSAVGSAHPWIGVFNHIQDATASVVGVNKHNVSDKFMVGAGIIQQYCTAATSCLAMDTFFKFAPSQQGFNVLGTSQNIGKQYLTGVNFTF